MFGVPQISRAPVPAGLIAIAWAKVPMLTPRKRKVGAAAKVVAGASVSVYSTSVPVASAGVPPAVAVQPTPESGGGAVGGGGGVPGGGGLPGGGGDVAGGALGSAGLPV